MPAHGVGRGRKVTTVGAVVAVVAGLLPALLLGGDAAAAVRPSKLVFTTQPGAGSPGHALATQPVVTTTDADGRTVTTAATLRLTLTGPAGAALDRLASMSCTDTAVTTSGGVANFAGCKVNRGGVFTLTAVDGADGLKTVSAEFFVSGPAALQLTGNPGGVAGGTWASQPEVTIVDGHGDPLPTATSHVVLGISAGSGTPGAQLTCTAKDVAAVSGVAHFAGCGIDRSGTGFRLVAIDATDSLISAPGPAFAVSAGTPSQLVFRTAPAGAVGGTAFVTQPVVEVQDAQGNTAIGNTDTVAISIQAGTGTPGAAVSCPSTAAVDGVASFDGCVIDRAGTGYVLVATDSAAGLSVQSAPITVTAGGATGLTFVTQPGGGAGGTAFGTQPVVRITDAGGNPVPGSVQLAIVPGTGTSGAALACDANPAPAADGTATFTGCGITSTGGGYRLRATSGSLTADSEAFDVSAGGPATATFTTQPGGGTGGSAFGTQPAVALTDSGGNPAAGPVRLAIATGTGTPGATLTCAGNPTSSAGGTATFAGCAIDLAGVGYRLVATSGSARRVSEPFDVTVGPAARLAFTSPPGGGTGGVAWAGQPTVAVQDAGGNLVAGNTSSIGLSVASGTGSGTLTCTANAVPAVVGSARFGGCAIDRTASQYRLTATDASDGLSVTSDPFAVVAGPAAALVFTAQPGGANAGIVLAAQPAVTAVDAGGNPATGAVSVALTVTKGTGGGGPLTCAARTRTAAPTAAFSRCALGAAGSGYTLTATAGTLRTESAPFAVLLPAPAPLGQAPTDVPVAQTFGGRDYGVNPTNVVDDVNTATGGSTFSRDDLTVAGIGMPFDLIRTYNSADTTGGSFGPGWSSLFDMNVTLSGPGNSLATVRGADGQQLVFTAKGPGGLFGWQAPPGARSSLTCNLISCTVTRFDGVSFTVSGGHVAAYQSAASPGLTFSWAAGKVTVTLASSGSRPVQVVASLDTTGRITKVASATRSVTYGYTDGLLSTVTDVLGTTWTYGYSARLLTGVTDPLGVVRQTVAYDTSGRVVATTQQGSAALVDDTFSWSTGTATRSALADVQGVVRRVDSTDTYVGHVLVQQTNPLGAVTRYSYDDHVNLVETQDPMGWVRQLSYDAADNLVRVEDPISSTSSAVVAMTYDAQHRLLTQTDPNGNTTTLTYDSTVLASARAAGVSPGTQYFHNLLTELARTRTSAGQEVYSYDAVGNLTGTRKQDQRGAALDGRGTLVTYDEAGHELTSVDPRGNLASGVDPAYASTWTYDAAGHQLTQTLPGPVTTSQTFDSAGDLASATDASGTTTYHWDQATRTMTIAAPSGTTTQTYDPSGHLLTQGQSTSRQATTHTYDAAGREISTTDAAGVRIDYTYDIEGNVVRATNTQGAEVVRQFDSLNRPVREVIDGVETRTTWDPAGNVTSTTDASGAITRTKYTTHNTIASVTTAAGTTRYSYDPASDSLLSTTDAAGHVTSYTYDALQRRTSTTKGGATTRYGYDLAGNVASTTDPDGRTTSITFNALNLPVTTTHTQAGQPTITVQERYDAYGRRTSMTDDTGTHTYTYDAAGNLTATDGPSGRFSYDFGTPGTITETYPDGTKIAYGVDDSRRLMSLTSGTPGTAGYVTASYVRDGNGQTTALAYSNGVLETRGYDRAGNLLDQQLRNASGALADDTFSYDAAGNRLTQRSTVGGTTTANAYGYDATGRLTSFTTASGVGTLTGATVPAVSAPADPPAGTATVSGGPDVSAASGVSTAVDPAVGGARTTYGYDAVGNRLTTTTSAGTTSTTHDSGDRVTRQSGATTAVWTYDATGNVTRMGTKRFTYDAAGRLATVTSGRTTVTYRYDGDGNRVSRTVGTTVTQYVWDTAGELPQLALELTGSGALVRRYLYGDGPVAMQTPTATYFFHLDPIGNVTELTDAHGAVAAAYHYDGFGNVTTTGPTPPANPLLFQSQYLDSDTGLYNMRARQYDPVSGRFTQRDPLEPSVGAPSESPYVFAANRPTVFTDPTGKVAVSADTFMGHANTETNVAANTKLGLTALGVGIKAVSKLGGYSAAVTQAATKTAVSAEVAAAANVGKNLAAVGKGLTVVGIALQVFITVEDCLTEDAYTCAGAVVGTTISIAFTVGCAVLTVGAGAVACAFAGAALSIGLQLVITEFGPQIADGLIAGYGIVSQGILAAAPVVARAVLDAANEVSSFAVDAGGAIVSGIHTATTAISSGFTAAVATLTGAGYAAAALADVLANSFDEGLDQALGTLAGLGYDVADLATAALDVFQATAGQLAGALKDGLGHTADQISGALHSAYDATAAATGQVLKGVGFAVDQVAGALQSTYSLAADATATVLDGIGYGTAQVVVALDDVFAQTDQVAAQIVAGLSATAGEVGAALRDFYDDADTAAAAALQFATYTAGQIAGALQSAYDDAAQEVAGILDGLQVGATLIAGALLDVFDTVDVQTAQILRTLGHGVLEVSAALQDAYAEAAQAVSSALRTVGYTAAEVGSALKETFAQTASAAAALLQTVGYDVAAVGLALKDTFAQGAADAAATLQGVGYEIADVTTVLAADFLLGASSAAGVLDDLFTTNAVALVLVSAFGQSADQVATIFKGLAYSATQIAQTLQGAFGQSAATAAAVLKRIGVAAADIASVLQNVFGQAVSDVASLLSSIGFSNDTINAIGGAFASFGQSVKDCFTSLFTDC